MPDTTPNYGLPFPEDGDPTDVAGDLERLASKVDEKLGEAGLTLSSDPGNILTEHADGYYVPEPNLTHYIKEEPYTNYPWGTLPPGTNYYLVHGIPHILGPSRPDGKGGSVGIPAPNGATYTYTGAHVHGHPMHGASQWLVINNTWRVTHGTWGEGVKYAQPGSGYVYTTPGWGSLYANRTHESVYTCAVFERPYGLSGGHPYGTKTVFPALYAGSAAFYEQTVTSNNMQSASVWYEAPSLGVYLGYNIQADNQYNVNGYRYLLTSTGTGRAVDLTWPDFAPQLTARHTESMHKIEEAIEEVLSKGEAATDLLVHERPDGTPSVTPPEIFLRTCFSQHYMLEHEGEYANDEELEAYTQRMKEG